MATGTFDRDVAARRLAETHFDVLVIGAGITGAGVALDAASRGLRTALVERVDIASGTSSKSSKLVHGGLRYLQQGDVRLVYEALAERQRLRRNAPHLVSVMPFLLPVFSRDGGINRKLAWALGKAMWMYDLTGGARIGKLHKKLDAAEALAYMPTLPRDRLAGGYLYFDAAADDARLTLALARTAAIDFGAVVVNRAPVRELTTGADGRLDGAVVDLDGRAVRVRADQVVNAAGVWSDQVRALGGSAAAGTLRPAKGIHITVPWDKVRNEVAVVVPVPKDKRSVFVVPWGDLAYVGTTDTDYDGPLDDPQCTADDIAYLLRAINFSVDTEITADDVLGTWAGLRPLVSDASDARTADLSRRHALTTSDDGLVTITGGKLTTYREMAEDTVDAVVARLDPAAAGRVRRRCRTASLRLRGADGADAIRAGAVGSGVLGLDAMEHLAGRYGGEARTVIAMVEADPALAEPLVDGLPYLRAEALYAVRYEMARTLDDVLSRRTRARLQARDRSAAAAESVAALIGPELGWDAAEAARQVAAYCAAVAEERTAPGLPDTSGVAIHRS